MDVSTVLGLLLATIFMLLGIVWSGGEFSAFMDIPSVMITVGGTLAALLAAYSLHDFANLPRLFVSALRGRDVDLTNSIDVMVAMAHTARRDGILALENAAELLEDDFLKKGILLVIDATDQELVKEIMEADIGAMENRHRKSQGMFDLMGTLAPAFGMLGTLIGLIIMLGSLEDPTALGSGMAMALVTTFYGSLIANIVAIPMANKLRNNTGKEILHKEILLEGILSIQAGENPRIIEEKLYSFLPRGAKMAKMAKAAKAAAPEEEGDFF